MVESLVFAKDVLCLKLNITSESYLIKKGHSIRKQSNIIETKL